MFTPPVEYIIEVFQGLRKAARKIGVAPSTIHGWKEKGYVPPEYQIIILDIAESEDLDITIDDVVHGRFTGGRH